MNLPSVPHLDVDVGELHAQAIGDEIFNQELIHKRAQSLGTALMVLRCQQQKLEQLNKSGITYEVLGDDIVPDKPP